MQNDQPEFCDTYSLLAVMLMEETFRSSCVLVNKAFIFAEFQQPELTDLSDMMNEGDIQVAQCKVPQMKPTNGETGILFVCGCVVCLLHWYSCVQNYSTPLTFSH